MVHLPHPNAKTTPHVQKRKALDYRAWIKSLNQVPKMALQNIRILVPTPLALFQVKLEIGSNTIKLGEPSLGKAPERLNTIDMAMTMGKLVIAMVDPEMFGIANIYQTIVTAPTIRVYDTIKSYFTENNTL